VAELGLNYKAKVPPLVHGDEESSLADIFEAPEENKYDQVQVIDKDNDHKLAKKLQQKYDNEGRTRPDKSSTKESSKLQKDRFDYSKLTM
jgi:hypothetical protein